MLSRGNTDIPTTVPWAAPTPPGRGANVSTFKGDCRLLQYQPFWHPVKTALTQWVEAGQAKTQGGSPHPTFLLCRTQTGRLLVQSTGERTLL